MGLPRGTDGASPAATKPAQVVEVQPATSTEISGPGQQKRAKPLGTFDDVQLFARRGWQGEGPLREPRFMPPEGVDLESGEGDGVLISWGRPHAFGLGFDKTNADGGAWSARSQPFEVGPSSWLSARVGGCRALCGLRVLDGNQPIWGMAGLGKPKLRDGRVDLAPWAGRRLVVEVFDEEPVAGRFVVVDEIVLHR